jgi:glycosyltransferase involved in cell wall biosynthesis
MKIALMHYTSPPVVGGVESVIAQHARLMTHAGHQVTIFAGRGRVFDEKIGVRILPLLDSRSPEVLRVKASLDFGEQPPGFDDLRQQIKSNLAGEIENYDVLIAHNVASLNKNLPLTAALHDLYSEPGFPQLVIWHHDLAWAMPRYSHELHEGYPWDLLRTPWQGVINVAVSEFRRQQLAMLLGVPAQGIRVITNGVDIATFFKFEEQTIQLTNQLNLCQADPLLLLPVRLTPRKNIELALQIIVELKRDFPDTILLVTGPEGPHNPANAVYKQKLLDLRRELGLQGVVHFLAEITAGYIPDEVIADFYNLSDGLLLPSREEGFGIPLIEAAVSSIPVFCADIPALRELGGDDVSYFNLDDDPRAIAGKIQGRLKSEATSRWSRRAKHSYTWDSIYATRLAPLLEEVSK